MVRAADSCAAPGGLAASFQRDAPRVVPLARWDADAAPIAKHGARFSGFLDGEALVAAGLFIYSLLGVSVSFRR